MEPWTALLRLVISLPLVLVLIYIFLKLGLGRRTVSSGGSMRIVDQISLGGKAYLAVVAVKDTYLLVSVNEKGTQVLKEFSDYPDNPAEFSDQLPPWLKKWAARLPGQKAGGGDEQ